jgi:hypothetical protein
MLFSAALIAAALSVSAPLAANAAGDPSISTNVAEASVYGSIQVTADGFAPEEELTVSFDSADQGTQRADAAGHLVQWAYVPDGTTLGTHQVHVTGATSGTQTAEITVVASPVATLSASTVTQAQLKGAGITATVTGFAPGETVQFGYGTGNSGSLFGDPVTADSDGVATIAVTWTVLFGSDSNYVGTVYITAANEANSISSTSATLVITADQAPVTPATPAVPVKATASFTG